MHAEFTELHRGLWNWTTGHANPDNTKINLLYGRSPNELYVTQNRSFAQKYANRKGGDGIILEFKVPKSYMKEHFTSTNPYTLMKPNYKMFDKSETGIFKEGLPVSFLTKVYK